MAVLAGNVMSPQTDGVLGRRHGGGVAAALRPRRGGGAVIGVERGFVPKDLDGSLTTLDAEGGVWIAVSNGGAVYRYSPDGLLEETLAVPVRKVTACSFGEDDLDRLLITASQEDSETAEDPLAGCLFCADVGDVGLPVRIFAG